MPFGRVHSLLTGNTISEIQSFDIGWNRLRLKFGSICTHTCA